MEFPYFLGYADEKGEGAGYGSNFNFPLSWDTSARTWLSALDEALARIREASAEALVVSLGLDKFKEDPISHFLLESDDYLETGRRIAKLGVPALFVLEGGYAVEALGVNAVNVLSAFDE